jgi:hypothetical protein
VVAGDLTSALYNVSQSGTAQHYHSNNATGLRQNFRTPTASPTGTVWFSFLADAEQAGDQAGISINPPTASPFATPGDSYAYFVGTTLDYSFGAGTAGTVANATTLGATALVVGKIILNSAPGGADAIELWVNPDLTADPNINDFTPVYSSSSVDWLTSISTIGAVAARVENGSTGGGDVDNILFSDGGGDANQAYTDVTGASPVPEPASVSLFACFAGLILFRPRRRIPFPVAKDV